MGMKLMMFGIPTGPDVRKLEDAFGKPLAGAEVSHEQIEEVLGVKRTTSRYKTVTLAWRKQLRTQHNIDLEAVPGTGFRSLTDAERVGAGVKGARAGVKKVVRSVKRSDAVVTEDAGLQTKQAVLRRLSLAMTDEFNRSMKSIEPPRPAASNPMPLPPQR